MKPSLQSLDQKYWEAPTNLPDYKKPEEKPEPKEEPILFAEVRNGKITWKPF